MLIHLFYILLLLSYYLNPILSHTLHCRIWTLDTQAPLSSIPVKVHPFGSHSHRTYSPDDDDDNDNNNNNDSNENAYIQGTTSLKHPINY